MCVIVYKPKSLRLKQSRAHEIFERAWASNPHGFGMAVYRDGVWQIKKGFLSDREEEAESLFVAEATGPSPLVAHWRLATHGLVSSENTHPFPIEFSNGNACLFHNGILDINPIGKKSDTATFCRVVSNARLTSEQFFKLLEGGAFEGTLGSSRIAILIDGEDEPVLVGNWVEKNGIWFSNSSLFFTACMYRTGSVGGASYRLVRDFWSTPLKLYAFSENDAINEAKKIAPDKVVYKNKYGDLMIKEGEKCKIVYIKI